MATFPQWPCHESKKFAPGLGGSYDDYRSPNHHGLSICDLAYMGISWVTSMVRESTDIFKEVKEFLNEIRKKNGLSTEGEGWVQFLAYNLKLELLWKRQLKVF